MKIQCDVCTKNEASVFCTADEAALCDACDHRVHHANKLAGKHHRFSLLLPSSPNQHPLCDICKERRAFLFCQQDRAILCRDCDLPIHKANEHTRNHNRFLLTGVKLSATAAVYSATSDSVPAFKSQKSGQISVEKLVAVKPAIPNAPTFAAAIYSATSDSVSNSKSRKSSQISVEKPVSVKPAIPNAPTIAATAAAKTTTAATNTSSISEYLIETLPGWRVEDLLDYPSPSSFGFCKSVGDMSPIWDADLENNLSCSFSSPENIGIWVPQAPLPLPPPPAVIYPTQYPSSTIAFGGQIGFKESKEVTNNKSSRKWRDDACFIVPQIIPPPTTSSKRSRTFW